MKIKEIGNTITRATGKFGLKVKKHSPEIMMVAGAVGVVTAAVMACKETRKIDIILDEHRENVGKIHKAMEHSEELPEEYTADDARKDLTITYSQTGFKLVKLYTPSVMLGALSLGMIFASNNVMRKRYASLSAAYVTLDSTFKKYRQNVIDKFGTEVDEDMRYSIKEHKVLDDEGKETGEVVKVAEVDEELDYSRWFEKNSSPYYESDSDYNLYFLKGQQAIINDKFQTQGFIFLNDVYKTIGLKPTKAGQIIGWIYDPTDKDFANYIDFGIKDYLEGKVALGTKDDRILLRFNPDGNILDLMK